MTTAILFGIRYESPANVIPAALQTHQEALPSTAPYPKRMLHPPQAAPLCLFLGILFGYTKWHVRFYFPNQGLNQCPLQGKCGVLITGPPGKSLPIPRYCCFSVTKLCLALCNPMNYRLLGPSVLHCLPEFVQIHVH